MRTAIVLLVLVAFVGAGSISAQEHPLELGFHVGVLSQDELDENDVGLGGRLGYRLTPILALEGEATFYPSEIPDEVPISSSRLEGLFGVRVGPSFERFAFFGKLRPGFVRFAEAPEPVACIAIFPPPLSCVLAAGKTVFALDLGGGFELYPSERTVVRVDLSSLQMRHSGPVSIPLEGSASDGALWTSNLRLSAGFAFRF